MSICGLICGLAITRKYQQANCAKSVNVMESFDKATEAHYKAPMAAQKVVRMIAAALRILRRPFHKIVLYVRNGPRVAVPEGCPHRASDFDPQMHSKDSPNRTSSSSPQMPKIRLSISDVRFVPQMVTLKSVQVDRPIGVRSYIDSLEVCSALQYLQTGNLVATALRLLKDCPTRPSDFCPQLHDGLRSAVWATASTLARFRFFHRR